MHDHEGDLSSEALRPRSSGARGQEPAAGPLKAWEGPGSRALDPARLLGLQRAAGNRATSGLVEEERSPVHDVVGSGAGSPLPVDLRVDMESRLGHDFGDVRVHTDTRAAESAESVQAHAYTVGSDVVFGEGRYDPTSTEGRTTLAHELTHVVQQRSGPVDGTPTAGGISVSDPSDRFEREAAATAEAAVAGPAATVPAGAAPVGVQREDAPEEEPEEEPALQGSFVQREEDEDDVDQDLAV